MYRCFYHNLKWFSYRSSFIYLFSWWLISFHIFSFSLHFKFLFKICFAFVSSWKKNFFFCFSLCLFFKYFFLFLLEHWRILFHTWNVRMVTSTTKLTTAAKTLARKMSKQIKTDMNKKEKHFDMKHTRFNPKKRTLYWWICCVACFTMCSQVIIQ